MAITITASAIARYFFFIFVFLMFKIDRSATNCSAANAYNADATHRLAIVHRDC